MPNDVILYQALASELNDILHDGRIEKIYQPEVDEITVSIKNKGKMHTLVVSASPTSPRIHLTTQKKENGLTAPAFCMLLRKYLQGGNISDVSVHNTDRIIKITIDARNELKDSERYFLIAELMGRYSNVILTDEEYKILDAIRRIHFDQSTTRYILPGLPYVLQPKNKAALDDEKALDKVFAQTIATSDELPKYVSGIGKESAKEIFCSDSPRKKIDELFSVYDSDAYSPRLLLREGKPIDYFVCEYKTIDGDFSPRPTLNECLDEYYTLYDGAERKKASAKTVTTVLKRLMTKNERRIKDNTDKIADKESMEKNKKYGELILNNLWQIKSGKTCTVFDYETEKDVTIPLDESLSPAINAQNYFKKYNKMKRGVEIAEQQLLGLYEQKEYLKSIEIAIKNCSTKQEFDEILNELNDLNGYKKKQKGRLKEKPSRPGKVLFGGCEIVFGKNNVQNAEVTFRIASRGDLWLHVKTKHGSHVVVRGEYNDNVLRRAAEIAAYYSEAREDDKVDVDYTLVKYVKKIPSSLPGQVTYTNYKTITVTPKAE
ncbi:MAG: NFACT family protein [Clostridia bacterium]|nr:NFACT family protein [Clostridia bacterium]